MIISNPGNLTGTINVSAKLAISGDVYHEVNLVDLNSIILPAHWHIKWSSVREIKLIVKLDYALQKKSFFTGGPADFLHDPRFKDIMPNTPGKGRYHFSMSWLVNYGANGLTLDPQSVADLGSTSTAGGVVVAVELIPNQSARESDNAFVSLLIKMKGGYSDEGFSFGIYGVGVNGVGASGSSFSYDVPLKALLYAIGRPSTEKQIVIPEDLFSFSIRFSENERAVSDGHLSRLDDWINRLKREAPNLTKAIRDGRVLVSLSGYASTTGSNGIDDRVSRDRVSSIEIEIKRKFESRAIRFVRQAKGHRDAQQKGAVAAERRVDIKIVRAEATRAVQKNGL